MTVNDLHSAEILRRLCPSLHAIHCKIVQDEIKSQSIRIECLYIYIYESDQLICIMGKYKLDIQLKNLANCKAAT
jgi:hypothetical protein